MFKVGDCICSNVSHTMIGKIVEMIGSRDAIIDVNNKKILVDLNYWYKVVSWEDFHMEERLKQLYSEPLPYDIDDVVYYMEKVSEIGGHPGFKLIKCYVHGYYNFGDGWKLKIRTNRNKFKFAEYDIPFSSAEYIVFKDKKRAEEVIRDLNGHIIK